MEYEIIELADGDILYVEVAKPQNEHPTQASLRDIADKATLKLSAEAEKIGKFIKEIRHGISDAFTEMQPNEIELEVGLEFNTKFGCVVVGSAVKAHARVKMKWKME